MVEVEKDSLERLGYIGELAVAARDELDTLLDEVQRWQHEHRAVPEARFHQMKGQRCSCGSNRLEMLSEGEWRCAECHRGWIHVDESSPMPGPAKPEPTQQHGYRENDLVWHKKFKRTEIIRCLTSVGGVAYAVVDADIQGHHWDIRNIVPVHRCPTLDYSDERVVNDGAGGFEMEGARHVYYLPNPSGAPGKPYDECSEEPLPVGTWVELEYGGLRKVAGVELEEGRLRYRSTAGTYLEVLGIIESRLPPDAIKCEHCGGHYVLPKEV